jgi:hypothetical protein
MAGATAPPRHRFRSEPRRGSQRTARRRWRQERRAGDILHERGSRDEQPYRIAVGPSAGRQVFTITQDFESYLLGRRGSTTRAKFLWPHKIPKAGAFYYERTMRHTQIVREWAAQSDVEEAIQLREV